MRRRGRSESAPRPHRQMTLGSPERTSVLDRAEGDFRHLGFSNGRKLPEPIARFYDTPSGHKIALTSR